MKKVAIVYYSMCGNTEYVAKYISEKIDADLIRITPKKEYPNSGLKKFFWGGKSSVMGETPELEEYDFDSSKYDYVILGTPVWASSFVPPIRTFVKENKEKIKEKKIAVFVCYSGSGAIKAVDKLKNYLEINEFDKKLILVDPKDKMTDEKNKEIEDFCVDILKQSK